jgi:hypothetical protein
MATYSPLQSISLNSASSSITFNNIPQTYTNLVIVCNTAPSTNNYGIYLYYNGSTGSNYSGTAMYGNGSTPLSARWAAINTPGTSNWVGGQILGLSNTLGQNAVVITVFNYSNTTTYKTLLSKSVEPNGVEVSSGLWKGSTEAITSITIGAQSAATLAAGSTFSLYGIKAGTPKAFGGDVVSTDGTYWYHAFKTSGTFTVQQSAALSVDYLVVAGGGSGGWSLGSGGGAGGFRASASNSLAPASEFRVLVGAGGAGGELSSAAGTDSSFNSFVSTGGGRGATGNGEVGGNGGSGGGGSHQPGFTAGGISSPTTSPAQGNSGGIGFAAGGPAAYEGGGGGAGGAGGNAVSGQSGNGGAGANSYNSITVTSWLSATGTGVSGYLAGGGGGANNSVGNRGTGGSGGGGTGGSYYSPELATSGTVNTGSGGGGGGNFTGLKRAGNGGSGLVIVRYPV